jgi:SAM-dependent methyltransferase
MHGTVQQFLANCARKYPTHFGDGCRVVEFGSRDINGTPRPHFGAPKEWVGIDCRKGKNVAVVGLCHEFDPEVSDFDVVVSTEALEHDPFWEKTLQQAAKLLRSGGVFALTCGSEHRPTHHEKDSPIPGYYGGRTGGEVREVLEAAADWSDLKIDYIRHGQDLMVVGVKA